MKGLDKPIRKLQRKTFLGRRERKKEGGKKLKMVAICLQLAEELFFSRIQEDDKNLKKIHKRKKKKLLHLRKIDSPNISDTFSICI